MYCRSRHRLPAFLVALMLAAAWMLQWAAILGCNFMAVNIITITNGSSHNLRSFNPAATSPKSATYFDYETSNVGVFCFANGADVSVFWKFCRTISICTIILTTLTVITSIACLLARISIPVEASRLWWGIGLISAIATLLSAPLFWLDPCEIVEATYQNTFDVTLATITSTCTPHQGFIQWILQGALQITVVIITTITKAPWDAVVPTNKENSAQPTKSLALMEDDEGLENEDDQNDSEMRIQIMERGNLVELLSDDNNSIAGKSVIEFSSSSTVGSELSDISIFTHKGAAFGSIPPLLSIDTHSSTSGEGINDETFNDTGERSSSSGEKENNAPLLYHHKLSIKRKKIQKGNKTRSPGDNEYDYIPPPSFELRSSFKTTPQSWSQISEGVDNCRNEVPQKAHPQLRIDCMLNSDTFPILVSNSEDDESNYVPHSIFSPSFSQRYWNNNNDQSFDEIWFASDTQSGTGSAALSLKVVEDNQDEHSKLSDAAGADNSHIDEERVFFENVTKPDTDTRSNRQLDFTLRDITEPQSVTVHIPPLSEQNLKLLDSSLEETIHDLHECKNRKTHSDLNEFAVYSPSIPSDDRREQQKYRRNQSSEGEEGSLPNRISIDFSEKEREKTIVFPPVTVHTPTLSSRNRKLLSATEDQKKSACYPAEEPSTPNTSRTNSSECLTSALKFRSPIVSSKLNNPEMYSGLHIPLSPITSGAESIRNATVVSSPVIGAISCSPLSGTRRSTAEADTSGQTLNESWEDEKENLVNNVCLVGVPHCTASSSIVSSGGNVHCAQNEDGSHVDSNLWHSNTGLNSASDQTNETVLFHGIGVERVSSDTNESLEKHKNENFQCAPESPVMTSVYALLGELKDHIRNQKMSPIRTTQEVQLRQSSTLNLPRLTHVEDCNEQPVEGVDSVPYDEVEKSQERLPSIIPVSPDQDIVKSNSFFVIKPTKCQQKKDCKTGKVSSVVTPENKKHPIASSTPPRYPRPYGGNRTKNRTVLRQVEMREEQVPNPLETLSSNEMEV